ncbi:hypothetical protein BSPWISOXPB_9145 [uncultured Gammaproteobacteria bacterium]|nr:hypothetical protein BSPWISOXPB_9145 [uncultured Gammaproteobacteria bacterium]
MDLSKTIDQHFPALGSNCALKASTSINTLVLSQHEGGECLDDVVHIAKDKALRLVTNQQVPTPQAIGTWLRRLGKDNQGIKACERQIKRSLKPHSITVKISLLILMPVKSLPIKQMPSGLIKAIRAICQWWGI